MTYWIGIDGGGSTLRMVIVDRALKIHHTSEVTASVNPNAIGRENAANTIQTALNALLTSANIPHDAIQAVGVGVAGALTGDMPAWLQATIQPVLPHAQIMTASDSEIALIGAHGQRLGILVIAGTGSIVCGINAVGDTALVGGWGYLIGDEGSGLWLGREALRAAVRAMDGRGPSTPLTQAILSHEQLHSRASIVPWVYQPKANVRDIAGLSSFVLEHAAEADPIALALIESAAQELALAVRTVRQHLQMEALPLVFAGGLLQNPNPLSNLLCTYLGLETLPIAKHPAAVGAAILAQSAS